MPDYWRSGSGFDGLNGLRLQCRLWATSIANLGIYINTVSMDLILGPVVNLNGLHIDLNGVGTG